MLNSGDLKSGDCFFSTIQHQPPQRLMDVAQDIIYLTSTDHQSSSLETDEIQEKMPQKPYYDEKSVKFGGNELITN